MTDNPPGLCPKCTQLVVMPYWKEAHCVICDLEKQRDAFKERNHHALDLARLSVVPLRTDCRRIDHAVEDLSKALSDMEAGLEAIAEGDCHYGDSCPTFGSRHGQCDPCQAREALEKARSRRDYCTDGSCATCKAGEPCH